VSRFAQGHGRAPTKFRHIAAALKQFCARGTGITAYLENGGTLEGYRGT